MIADQPQAQRISTYSWGGTPSGIAKQTHKLFCQIAASDPGSVPLITTYFLHPNLGGCATTKQIDAYMPKFKEQINAMANATGRHPAVYLLELDAIGSSVCMAQNGALPAWEAALRYEMHAVQSLPHTVVYVEGGYSDSNSVGYTARVLKAIDVNTIRGFFTNDTHNQWTSSTVAWATKVARRTGSHFIVNTSDNGQGPKLNPHPQTQGVEDLCNPPGRGLGIEDTTDTGSADADGFLWTHSPGMSAGTCGGGPASGFWPAKAEGEAALANAQLGPGFPSQPVGPEAHRRRSLRADRRPGLPLAPVVRRSVGRCPHRLARGCPPGTGTLVTVRFAGGCVSVSAYGPREHRRWLIAGDPRVRDRESTDGVRSGRELRVPFARRTRPAAPPRR